MHLATQLKKSFGASKAKTGALAALVGVGLCFWVPMLSRAKNGRAATPARAVRSRPVAARARKTPTPAAPVRTAKSLTLEVLTALAETHGLVQAPDPDAVDTDPFSSGGTGVGAPAGEEHRPDAGRPASSQPTSVAHVAPPPAAPSQIDLALSATICSAGFKAAVIGGDVFVVGDRVPRRSSMPYTLVSISSRKVTLSRNGQRFDLTMPDKEDAE